KKNVFSCVTCTATDSAEVHNRNSSGYDPDAGNNQDFLRSAEDFGPSSRKLDVTGFRKVSVVGPFYVKITNGSTFKVNARGNANDLEKMRYEVEGNELTIYPKKSGFSLGRSNM